MINCYNISLLVVTALFAVSNSDMNPILQVIRIYTGSKLMVNTQARILILPLARNMSHS